MVTIRFSGENFETEIEIPEYVLILCAISNLSGERGYVPIPLKKATDKLLDEYPDDGLRTIIRDRVDVFVSNQS